MPSTSLGTITSISSCTREPTASPNSQQLRRLSLELKAAYSCFTSPGNVAPPPLPPPPSSSSPPSSPLSSSSSSSSLQALRTLLVTLEIPEAGKRISGLINKDSTVFNIIALFPSCLDRFTARGARSGSFTNCLWRWKHHLVDLALLTLLLLLLPAFEPHECYRGVQDTPEDRKPDTRPGKITTWPSSTL